MLIISPYFPPSNTADMQRLRTSLPYFGNFGWDATVVTVDEQYSETVKDPLLNQSIPASINIYNVKALSKRFTSKLGLGSLALRSMPFYRKTVNRLLHEEKFDLIYFTTTQFMICALGAYWKKRFGVPYVVDMQDPWYSTHYKQKPKDQRPSKYHFAYALHRYLEPIAIKNADGLISVSDDYISDLKERYPGIAHTPSATITFGAFAPDNAIATQNSHNFPPILQAGFTNIVYIGRGGADMHKALKPVFEALKKGIIQQPNPFKILRFYFIGTSYAPAGTGVPTISPLARQIGVNDQVVEITDRISYYHTLSVIQQADALLVTGSEDPKYTASKIFPYLLAQKPMLAIFNENSNSVAALNECATGAALYTFNQQPPAFADDLYQLFTSWSAGDLKPVSLLPAFENYSAKTLTGKQTALFEQAIAHHKKSAKNIR